MTGNRGGKRAGAGRKRNDPPTDEHTFSVTKEQAKMLRMLGKGDMSLGLRWLIDAATPLLHRPESNSVARSG